MRRSGVLLPVTSLPSRFGIGTFSKEAYAFVDFLKEAGQKLWQILPLGPTGYGDSPYQAFSTFAGNPYLIDLEELIENGWLTEEECENTDWGGSKSYVDYEKMYQGRFPLLRKAYHNSHIAENAEFIAFCEENDWWLSDYALFMAIKDSQGGASFLEWDAPLKLREPEAIRRCRHELSDEICFWQFLQYLFAKQWQALKAYANGKGISIIGDIPIYVALDSADVWANRELFQLEKDGYPTVVAGVPPDYFSATGQLWGNPLYDWDYHKKTHYDWWMRRIKGQLNMVDYIRVDHFRGFEQYYAIPYGEETAMHGKWKKGPNEDLFLRMQEVFGKDLPIWAEDLGIITPRVEKLRDDFNLPGMKVLQFAFGDPKDNDILPHRFTTENCICYTGTHDNDTTMGWYQTLKPALQDRVRRYLNTDGNIIHYDMIRAAMGSIARYAIYPIQDLLGFGSDCRMNTPSVAGGNWAFRFRKDHLTPELAANLRKMTELFGRCEPLEPIEEEEGPEGSIKPGETAPGLAPEE